MQKLVSIGATHILGLTLALTSTGASAQTDSDYQPERSQNVFVRHPVRTVVGAGALVVGAVVLHRSINKAAVEAPLAPTSEMVRTTELRPRDFVMEVPDSSVAFETEPLAPSGAAIEDVSLSTTETENPRVAGEEHQHVLKAEQLGLPPSLGEIPQDAYILKEGSVAPVVATNPDTGKTYAIVLDPQHPGGLLRVVISPSLTHDSFVPGFNRAFELHELTAERLAKLDPTALINQAAAESLAAPQSTVVE